VDRILLVTEFLGESKAMLRFSTVWRVGQCPPMLSCSGLNCRNVHSQQMSVLILQTCEF
jgi:hypothetical protein